MEQYLTIHAKYYTPVADSHSIPTGVYEEVAGTPMDSELPRRLDRILKLILNSSNLPVDMIITM